MGQLCQSVVLHSVGAAFACEALATRVLFGIHLCGTHERNWKNRVAGGQKIRIHPERALALNHRCETGTVATKRCSRCGLTKPETDFYRKGGKRRGRMAVCIQDFNGRKLASKHAESVPAPAPQISAATAMVAAQPVRSLPPPPLTVAVASDARRELTDPSGASDRYVLLVELVCGMCSRKISDVKVADLKAPLLMEHYPRCEACGGQAMRSGEFTRQFVGPNAFGTDPFLRRRGRPPKALVEARRAEVTA